MPNDKEIQLPPYDEECNAIIQYALTLESGAQYSTASFKAERDCRSRQLKEVIAEVDRLKLDLKAMTEDRNLWQDEHNGDCPNLAELAQLKQQSVDLKEALAFIAYGKQHTGVIPCPQDYHFYISPFRDRAREALDALNIPEDNDETD